MLSTCNCNIFSSLQKQSWAAKQIQNVSVVLSSQFCPLPTKIILVLYWNLDDDMNACNVVCPRSKRCSQLSKIVDLKSCSDSHWHGFETLRFYWILLTRSLCFSSRIIKHDFLNKKNFRLLMAFQLQGCEMRGLLNVLAVDVEIQYLISEHNPNVSRYVVSIVRPYPEIRAKQMPSTYKERDVFVWWCRMYWYF